MLKKLRYLWLCLPLMACQVSEEKAAEEPEPVPAVAPITELAQEPVKPQEDEDVKALFEQKFIDPLTQYLEKYQDDESKREHLAVVREERDKRCAKIATWYEKKEATEENLNRLKGGYSYSCMPLVVAFSERVASASTALMDKATNNEQEGNAELLVNETDPVQVKVEQKQERKQPQPCQQSMTQNNYTQIAKYCPPLAQQGNLKAQLKLAKMYADGKGVPQSDQQAVKWYQLAAKQGDKMAQSALGVSYYTGNGVTQDYRKAASWQRKAANQGHPEAQFILGVMYELGQGVPQDFVLAYKWFLLAASQGAKGAMESRGSLAAKLSPEQIQEGQRLAREWSAAN